MLRSQGYVRVQEAATLLGVSANTIRNWGADGKLPEYRHPVNNHRLFRRADLELIMEKLEASVETRTRRKRNPRKPR